METLMREETTSRKVFRKSGVVQDFLVWANTITAGNVPGIDFLIAR